MNYGKKYLVLLKKKEEDNSNSDIPDSDLSPEYLKFMESRNRKKTNTKPKPPERIPETD